MNIVTIEDVNYLVQQSSGRTNMILSGMTELMNDTEGKVAIMESQGWFQRMVKTVTGKNKLTQLEIQQNHDKLNAYMSEAIAELYNRNCIDYEVMISLGIQLNELYADHLQFKQMLGAFVEKLNDKIESVDNFNMLITEINQGVYSNYSPIVAICKVIAQFDKRILEDNRKLDILRRSLMTQNIINNKDILLTEYLNSIIEVSVEEIGQIHLEIGTIRENFMANIILRMIEKYHFLPDMARKIKNKKSLVDEIIKEENLDELIVLSISEIYDDFIKSKIDIKNRVILIDDVKGVEVNSKLNDSESILKLAYSYYWGKDIEKDNLKALEYFEKAYYEYGSAEAANMIGLMYKQGEGIAVDNECEFMWIKRAAELSSFYWDKLADYYYDGRGTKQDNLLAKEWYTKAANEGNDYAITKLGIIEMDSNNYQGAVEWFRKAAKNGYADAQNRLGVRYTNGQGVTKNYEEAFKWFLKAAEQGHMKAQSNVGDCYYQGDGVSKDNDKSKEWLRKSAEQGHKIAKKLLYKWYGESRFIDITSDMLYYIKTLCELFIVTHNSEKYKASCKLKNALGILHRDIYLNYDDTLFGTGKEGFAITEKGIYCRGFKESCINYVSFEKLTNAESIYIIGGVSGNSIYAGKEIIACITNSDDTEDLKKLFEQIHMFLNKSDL